MEKEIFVFPRLLKKTPTHNRIRLTYSHVKSLMI